MKYKNLTSKCISFLLAVVMVVSMLPGWTVSASAEAEEEVRSVSDFAGKTLSILGASTATYAGVSNNAADNSTIGGNAVYYTEGRHGVYLKDTWWQQVIDVLGMRLLVNNSWSGSCVFQPRQGEASVGYGDRAVNLHNDYTGEEPDVILVYIGGNDFAYYKDTFGRAADVDYSALINDNGDGTFTYAVPASTCEAYAIMLHKAENRYPDAQIYCMTSTARRDPDYEDSYPDTGQPTEYSAELIKVAEHFGFPVIDLEDCIPKEAELFDQYMGDKRAHPNALGMDQISNEVLSVMLGRDAEICHVISEQGIVAEQAVLLGGIYSTEVNVPEGYVPSVVMDGEDITDEVYSDGYILIEKITGDIEVGLTRAAENFCWETNDNSLVSSGETANPLTMLSGTVTDGVFNGCRYQLTIPVVLMHDRPWVLEWKCAGDWRASVFSSNAVPQTTGVIYLSRTKGGQLCFGTWTGTQYDNYGVDISCLDNQTHTYRLENRIAEDGSNMVWLYVDEAEIGPMNNYFIGSTSQNVTSDWLSGKDIVFPYIGTESNPINSCQLEYLTVTECEHAFENETCSFCGEDASDAVQPLSGKTLSILGASISTYAGTSNGDAADTTNSTIRGNAKYYPHSVVTDVTLKDTWWMQAANDLGLRLLVNNSWSGSSLLYERGGTVGAYVDRCVQLHDDTGDNAGETPDIIAIQMGTNDFQYYKDTLGTADIDYAALMTENADGTFTYAEPVTSLEAAAIVLHKISVRYPDAEVYYLNISQRVDGTDDLIQSFNAELKQVVEHFGAHIVDIYGSAITMENFDTYIGDGRVHPNRLGMDAYTEAFKRALLANTAYEVDTHTVSFDLTGVTADYGDDKIVVDGDGFTVELTANNGKEMAVTVTMGGEDITDTCYAGGTVTIDAVTADVTITAEETDHVARNYRWEFDGTDLVCVDGENTLTKNAGTTTDGVFSQTSYALADSVVLLHDQPWVVEWKCEGTFRNTGSSSGARIFTSDNVNANYNARYIFKSDNNGIIAMGEKTSSGSHNYGIALGDYGIDWTELHTYRLENRIAEDGSNMVWLYVDGVEIGAMNHYYLGTTDKGTTSDWLSGKDFVFPYMGTDTHGFTNASIDYIQVWEAGHIHDYSAVVTPPTCTEQGYTTYTCDCGDSCVDDYTDATGHSFDGDSCTACGMESPANPISFGWPLLNTDLTHIICYGQSFSNGSDAPLYADPAVEGVYVYGNIADSSNGTALTPLATTGNQHPIISAGNSLAQMLAAAGYDTDLVLGSYGTGGKTIAQLMSAERQAQIKEEEGYDYDCLSSGRYEVFQNSVKALAEYAGENQLTVSCPVIVYLQGETDQNTDAQLGYPDDPIRAGYGAGGDKEKYKEYMTRLKEDMQAQVMEAYGQTEKPLFVIYQVSGTYVRTDYSAINMAQIEFAQENEDVILVQTPYFTPHYTGSHHLTVNGYRWLGEYIAQYIYTALVEREKPWPMLPERIEITDSRTVRISVSGVEGGLSIDTYTVENASNGSNLYGFNLLVDGAVAVPAAVEVSGGEILLTLPEGTDLTAAESVHVQYGGRRARGTGNIRDNCADVGFYEYLDDSADTGTGNNQGVSHSALDAEGNSLVGEKYPLYNWLASFSYDIKAGTLHVHSYTETVVAPACSSYGYTACTCTCGEFYAEEYVPATGVHSYEPVITAPTCTEDGYTSYVCICGDVASVGDAVPALGHTEVVDPMTLPTGGRTGLTEGSHCETCGEILTAQDVIPATGYSHALEDGAFKVLLIGNTFSEDAANYGQGMTGSQLLDILQAMLGENVEIVIGLCHRSATSMAWHATQAEQGNALYSFRIIDSESGVWRSAGSVSSADALKWADWDAVVLQPFSTEAFTGNANPIHADQEDEKFYPLEVSTAYMLDHVNTYAPNAEIYCFMHWQRTKTNQINVYLGSHNSMAGFFPIVMEYRGTASGARFGDVIPVGTAVQNARTTYLALLSYNAEGGMNLTDDPQFGLQRDENHLSLNVGRYIAALTFAETIIPEEMRAEGYVLPDIRITESVGELPKEYTTLAQKAVTAAVESWKSGSLAVTTIEGYEVDPADTAAARLEGGSYAIACAADANSLTAQLSAQILADLPADFAVDAVTYGEDFDFEGEGQAFAASVTIRFGYTSRTVNVSGAIGAHSYEPEVTPPTCTEQGYTTYTCTLCGDSCVDDYVEALGHSYSAWEEVTAPTCDSEGQDKRTCTCGHEEYRDTRISGDPNKILVSNPVEEDFFAGKVIMAIGDSLTAGTGVTAEQRYHYLAAQALGMTNINSGTSGAVLCPGGHLPNKFETLMTEDLLTKRNVDVVTIFLGINDWDNGVVNGTYQGKLKYDESLTYYDLGEFGTDDTTTIYGAAKMWCERILELQATEACKDVMFVFATPVITSYNKSVTAAKDWDQDKVNVFGYTLRQYCTAIMEVCAHYGVPVLDLNMYSGMYYHSEDDNNVDYFGGDGIHPGANGHAMMADALVEFLREGYTYEDRFVTDCGHSYETAVTEPTCTEDGYTTYRCPDCHYSYVSDYVEATGHVYVTQVTEPTCTEQGYTTYTCTLCGDSYVDDYVEAKGHDYSAGLCATCGHDAVSVTISDGTLTVTCGELEAGTLLYLAAYDEYGKFLSLTKIVWGGGEQTLTLPEGEKWQLMFVNSSWTPLRTHLEF